jgi:hypothetical protein
MTGRVKPEGLDFGFYTPLITYTTHDNGIEGGGGKNHRVLRLGFWE